MGGKEVGGVDRVEGGVEGVREEGLEEERVVWEAGARVVREVRAWAVGGMAVGALGVVAREGGAWGRGGRVTVEALGVEGGVGRGAGGAKVD